jgi:endosialidase-like protein
MNPLNQHNKATVISLSVALIVCLGPLQNALALNPPPDGGYPNANTAEGSGALSSLTTGSFNTATGWLALRANTTATANTAVGAEALRDSNGDANTAIGSGALFTNTIGGSNTAIGANTLRLNTTGNYNVASGFRALASNTAGNYNMASGFMALNQNTINDFNTAIGAGALFFNTADENTAVGAAALLHNSTGDSNTAAGSAALFRNTNGAHNTANGFQALATNTTGNDNTALGFLAGSSQTTGSDNIYIGSGVLGLPGESNACYIASIFGQTIANGAVVLVNQSNKLGTLTSSKRFKEDIKPMNKSSEALFALKPVAFRYKKEIDPAGRSQLGLVAEDVEKVDPDLVVRDKEGKPYSVRYDQVNAMLLNEFLKAHKKIEEQEVTIAQLKKQLQATAGNQQKQIEALTAGLQKVSARLELNKAAPQTVLNRQ